MNIKELIQAGGNVSLNVSPQDLLDFGRQIANDIVSSLKSEQPKEESEDDLLTRDEILKTLSISATTLWHWQEKKFLTPIRFGNSRRVYFRRSEIQKILDNEVLSDEETA